MTIKSTEGQLQANDPRKSRITMGIWTYRVWKSETLDSSSILIGKMVSLVE